MSTHIQIGSQVFYGTTNSAANTFTASINGVTALVADTLFIIKFVHKPTDAATLNINGLGAVPIVTPTGSAISGVQGVDNQVAMLFYDGTSFIYVVQPNNA